MDLADLPKTRAEAKASGAKYYFTGTPCKHGHIAPRLTKGTCTVCLKAQQKKDQEVRKGKPKSEAAKAAGKRYYEKNKELVKLRATARDKEKQRESKRKWKRNNREACRVDTNTRRRRLRDATPCWVGTTEKARIKEKYAEAARKTKETGVKYVVDHDLPIAGVRVCGLHVYDNLVVMPFTANARKSNKF